MKNFKSVVVAVVSLGLIASCSMFGKHSHKCHHGAKCSEKKVEESKGAKAHKKEAVKK